MKILLKHIYFGLVITAIFGLLGLAILFLPIFLPNTSLLEIVGRCILTIGFLIGLFICGVKFSINDDKNKCQKCSLWMYCKAYDPSDNSLYDCNDFIYDKEVEQFFINKSN